MNQVTIRTNQYLLRHTATLLAKVKGKGELGRGEVVGIVSTWAVVTGQSCTAALAQLDAELTRQGNANADAKGPGRRRPSMSEQPIELHLVRSRSGFYYLLTGEPSYDPDTGHWRTEHLSDTIMSLGNRAHVELEPEGCTQVELVQARDDYARKLAKEAFDVRAEELPWPVPACMFCGIEHVPLSENHCRDCRKKGIGTEEADNEDE